MASESPQMEDLVPQADTGQQDSTLDTNNSKRKADQTNGTHTRTKRNRYISIAWYVWARHINQGGNMQVWHDADDLWGLLVMNASDAKSSAMDKCRVNDVDISTWSVSATKCAMISGVFIY